jgi:hypothetical protein
MWGHDKLKEWVRENFAYKSSMDDARAEIRVLRKKVDALSDHLGVEFVIRFAQDSGFDVIKKGKSK